MTIPEIDPELEPILEAFPARVDLHADRITEFRSVKFPPDTNAFFPNAQPPKYHNIKTPDGMLEIYEFQPSRHPKTSKALLWVHGGGYVTGHGNDVWFGALFAEQADMRVFSVHYRLAPEHPYPAALQDCFAALNWLSNQSSVLGIDRDHISIGGASAGGGLAAALAIFNRNQQGPDIKFQLLLYPMLDNRHDNPAGYMKVPRWPRQNSLTAWDMYLGGSEPVATSVPNLETNFDGLPPAFLTVGEADLFLDDVRAYAAKLESAAVPVELRTYPGVFHAAEMFGYHTQIGRQMTNDYVAALKSALSK